ncbi:zinc finger protein 253-like isoform X2 [Copidosoma floridanum]|uniref:zinc finger protein 253-like isoform X2 n=1 Tax=Copidosoma floridanum TaxID=29053 RepID=UPI0006C96EDF|nr:zinc finger protein 253-like isoform X2 [Copidosoma floridanum]
MMPSVEAEANQQQQQQQLCRLCAEPRNSLVGIYEPEGQKLDIKTKITKCLHIQVPMQQALSRQSFFASSTTDLEATLNSSDDVHSSKENHYTGQSVENYFEVNVKIEKSTQLRDNHIFMKEESPNGVENEEKQKKAERENNFLKLDQPELQDFLSDESEEESNKKVIEECSEKTINNQIKDAESRKVLEHQLASGLDMKEEQKINHKKKDNLERYPWLCTDCNDKLPSLEALEEHHEIIHNQKAKYMCVQCCKVYEKYYGFLTHVKRHKTKTKYSCDDCGKTFVHKKVLDTHKSIHSEERPHICQTCGKTFRQQSALYIHSRCHLPENMKSRFPCDQCDKRFSTKPNLVTHKRIHTGVRNFTCDQCGKSFIQKGNLEAHFLTHSADKPYTCSQCPKAFKTPLQLKKHESVHTGAKPHQCNTCGRTFREKGTLREHHRIHTGAMPFSCEFCGKCFRFKGILTTHRRQHTGERPYSCLECQHHFTNWPNYNKHMKRRHGINTSNSKRVQSNQQLGVQQQLQSSFQQLHNNQSQTAQTTLIDPQITPTTVQVIQSVPQVSVTTQPLVLQTLASTDTVSAIQTFTESVDNPASISVAPIAHHHHLQPGPVHVGAGSLNFRERQYGATSTASYFNMGMPLSTFLPPSSSYNFYNIGT